MGGLIVPPILFPVISAKTGCFILFIKQKYTVFLAKHRKRGGILRTFCFSEFRVKIKLQSRQRPRLNIKKPDLQ